jgi:hypothetical protein
MSLTENDFSALAGGEGSQGLPVVIKERTLGGRALRPYSEGESILVAECKFTTTAGFMWVVAYVLATPREQVLALINGKDAAALPLAILNFADAHAAEREQVQTMVLEILAEAKREEVKPVPKGEAREDLPS